MTTVVASRRLSSSCCCSLVRSLHNNSAAVSSLASSSLSQVALSNSSNNINRRATAHDSSSTRRLHHTIVAARHVRSQLNCKSLAHLASKSSLVDKQFRNLSHQQSQQQHYHSIRQLHSMQSSRHNLQHQHQQQRRMNSQLSVHSATNSRNHNSSQRVFSTNSSPAGENNNNNKNQNSIRRATASLTGAASSQTLDADDVKHDACRSESIKYQCNNSNSNNSAADDDDASSASTAATKSRDPLTHPYTAGRHIRNVLLYKKVSLLEEVRRGTRDATQAWSGESLGTHRNAPAAVATTASNLSSAADAATAAAASTRTTSLRTDTKVQQADREHQHTVNVVRQALHHNTQQQLAVREVERITAQDIAWAHLVVCIGGDGSFLRVSKHIQETSRTAIVGINSSPSSSFGFFCAAESVFFCDVCVWCNELVLLLLLSYVAARHPKRIKRIG